MDRVLTREMIAIIPARGGSKRIPKKNIVDFGGKPMIAWTIDAAQKSGAFDRVVVSTDSPEIAEIARQFGAEVPFLRSHAFDDVAPVTEGTLAALEQSGKFWGETYRVVVQLMPNCPLRGASEISEALARFHGRKAEFLLSCCRYGWMNPWWAHRVASDGSPSPLFADALKQRSQSLETLYCPTGAVWIATTSALRSSRSFYGPGHIFHPFPWISMIDIDDMEDLEMARAALLAFRRFS